ncbi:hypothetical protein PsorP6_011374 [Peronosclerospora sorghi]|uniref:Uncharacterized protein n=1 Tax=Peronosclerospora sorghi TaxID=230839 RepID=A0ACC0WJL9_9STRA|nr:hypothetical protein PsorP6_011374 [Peronosclerospora sorghi]
MDDAPRVCFSLEMPETPESDWNAVCATLSDEEDENPLRDELYPVASLFWRHMAVATLHDIWCTNPTATQTDRLSDCDESRHQRLYPQWTQVFSDTSSKTSTAMRTGLREGGVPKQPRLRQLYLKARRCANELVNCSWTHHYREHNKMAPIEQPTSRWTRLSLSRRMQRTDVQSSWNLQKT